MKPWMIYVGIALVAIAIGFAGATWWAKRKGQTPGKKGMGLTPEETK